MYDFTTPRGHIEITARPIAHSLTNRLIGLVVVLVAALIVWLLTRPQVRLAFCRACGSLACGLLVVLLGLFSVLTGVFPFAGLVVLAAGIVLCIRSRCCPAA